MMARSRERTGPIAAACGDKEEPNATDTTGSHKGDNNTYDEGWSAGPLRAQAGAGPPAARPQTMGSTQERTSVRF